MCFFWFLMLPLSEAERAVVLGYSLTRIVILLIFAAIIIIAVVEFLQCLLRPDKSRQMQAALRGWFARRDFPATSLLACLAAWGLLGMAAEIILNPAWFPRSILYHFLYIRIRPIFLWSVLVSVQAIILVLVCGWYRLKNDTQERQRPTGVLFWGMAVLAAGNLALWGMKAVAPHLFDNQHAVILAIIILLALGNIGLAGFLHFRRGQS